MQTNLLKAKLKEIEKVAKTSTEEKKRTLRTQYSLIKRQINTIEKKPVGFIDKVVDSIF